MEKIGIIGMGVMGSGITQICAQTGYEVGVVDISEEVIQKGMDRIKKNLSKLVEKDKITQKERDETIRRIKTTTDMEEAIKDVSLVIEAVPEDLELKKDVFKRADEICPEDVVLASNTSSLSITEMASATNRQGKVVGIHFFNPAPLMPLVEVIRGVRTSDDTVRRAKDLAEKLGKTPVEARDFSGFIANRIAMPMLNEAMYVLMEGVSDKESIDKAMKLGYNHSMGPLELIDLIGLDTVLSILDALYEEFGDPKYRPCPLLKQMVRAGNLGRKAGSGFYEYE